MVEQSSSPPHSFAASDLALSAPSEPTPETRTSAASSSAANSPSSSREQLPVVQTEQGQTTPSENADGIHPSPLDAIDGDDSSNSGSNSESSTSTETPGTISTPRSSAHDSGQPIPESSTTQLSDEHAETATPQLQDDIQPGDEDSPQPPPSDPPIIPPPPVDVDIAVMDTTPDWVKYEEDTSVPDAEEMKEIDADKNELDATNTAAIEKEVFADLDDPDLRPCKKIRLSWIVKGVRGTKERPNRARIMSSPAVKLDGKYWNIKFFPRGNKSRNSLAAFVRCSPVAPESSEIELEGSFKCYDGLPDADLSKTEPVLDMKLVPSERVEENPVLKEKPPPDNDLEQEPDHNPPTEVPEADDDDNDDDSVSDDEQDQIQIPVKKVVAEDFRVSAQLGIVIYNPDEPRTCYTSSVSHQFYPHSDEWGRDPIVSQYEEIHRRKRGQRQALLRNDTLAIDAYVRIYDDPTQALFWDFAGEAQWDSKRLAGYYPMGTRLLYHSPATAGITAYTLLAPFRKAIQQIDAGAWRQDSSVRPRALIAHLQLMLFQMRHMVKEELYVHLDSVIHEISRSGESFDNVNMFWETFRRSIEIEAGADTNLISTLNQIFGDRDFSRKLPLLPVKNVDDLQESVYQAFDKAGIRTSLPDFLPLTLQRQSFDVEKRQWQLHNNRVRISEEIDLSRFSTDSDAKFVLYGFIVHDGDRTSGKFFSVLRPTGPGGKWLVFSDGSGNKVFSYTKKRISEYEGLDLPELKKAAFSGQTMHTALYLRSSKVKEYLSDEMEPFRLPLWLKPHLDERYNYNEDNFESKPSQDEAPPEPVRIEVFWDKIVGGQEGKLDLYKLKSHPKAQGEDCKQHFTADRTAPMSEIHSLIASTLQVDEQAFKLWGMNYNRLGGVSKGYMCVLRNASAVGSCLGTSEILTLWLTMVPGKYAVETELLATNFKNIGGKHVEAPPKPVFEIPKSPRLPPTEEVQANVTSEGVPAETTGSMTPVVPPTLQDAEASSSTQEVSAEHTSSSINEENASSETIITAETDEQAANQDAEQESVRQAVEQTVQSIPTTAPSVAEVEGGPWNVASAPAVVHVPQTSQITADDQPAPELPEQSTMPDGLTSESPTGTDMAILPETTPSDTDVVQPVTPGEGATHRLTAPEQTNATPNDAEQDTVEPPVVHGHLFEASSHEESGLPVGVPIAFGNDRIILLSSNQEDISAEDAALITSMIAADIEAVERERQANNAEGGDNDGERADMMEIDSRPSTPRQRVADKYGFLHVFDADKQEFRAHSTFMVPADTTISAMVRKQLGYDEDRSFHLWKRDGTYRTTGVSLESTFMEVSLNDCCEVIVGEHLGEKKMESLKAEAKYVDPGQLMRYLAMVQRKHPTLARNSTEVVEISEFGGDYYKGPIVRGQRHGQECSLITQSGDTYEGPLVAGQKSGAKGRMTYQNGDVYEGGWLEDQKHGQGEFLEKRTGNRYVGGYENDKRWGKGVTYWEVADQQAALCQVCYFEEVDALFYRCGHVVACYACAKQCASDSNGCPVCRRPIEAVVRMYRS